MEMVDAIRRAESEYVIYFLLNAYIEALQFSRSIPRQLLAFPVKGLADVSSCFEKLVSLLATAGEVSDRSRMADLGKAIYAFDIALSRLRDRVQSEQVWVSTQIAACVPELEAA